MQKYGQKSQSTALIEEPTKAEKSDESIDKKVEVKTADKEKKLEEVAKSIKQHAKEKELEVVKEENGFVAYSDKNSAVKTYNSGTEEFYSSNAKDYYSSIIRNNDDAKPINAPQAEHHEQKSEESAEKAAYVVRESLVFGDNI